MNIKYCLKCKKLITSKYGIIYCSRSCAISVKNSIQNKINPPRKGTKHTNESKRLMSIAHTGKKLSEEHKRKVGEASKGRTHTEETRRKLSIANTGRKHSEETKRKLSALYYSLYRGILDKYEDKRIKKIKEVRTGVPHSIETRNKMSVAATGSNNSAWKGGISPQTMLDRVSVKYKAWRLDVYRRDSFRCQTCGTNKRIHAHHKVKFADNKELRYELNNGITLCYLCHKKLHAHSLNLLPMNGMPMSNMEQYTRGV